MAENKKEQEPSATVRIMRDLGIPETRDNFVDTAFGGTPPEEGVGAELEATFPKEFQKGITPEKD